MRKLWFISWAMVAVGIVMAVGGVFAGYGPVLLVCGVLLIWSGLVKGIVLRIWHATLVSPPVAERELMRPDMPRTSSGSSPS